MSQAFLMGLDLGGGSVRCAAARGRLREGRLGLPPLPAPRPAGRPDELGVRRGPDLGAARRSRPRGPRARRCLPRRRARDRRHRHAPRQRAARRARAACCSRPRIATRAASRAALELAATHGDALHRRTGHWPNPVQPAGRLLWLARNAAELLERATMSSLGQRLDRLPALRASPPRSRRRRPSRCSSSSSSRAGRGTGSSAWVCRGASSRSVLRAGTPARSPPPGRGRAARDRAPESRWRSAAATPNAVCSARASSPPASSA